MNHTKAFAIQTSERKSTQPTGRADLLENQEENYQIVFLPGLDLTDAFTNLVEVTRSAPSERVITDTGQEGILWQVEPSDDSISFLDDLLAPIALPTAHQGELNTPTIGESLLLFNAEVDVTADPDESRISPESPKHFSSRNILNQI